MNTKFTLHENTEEGLHILSEPDGAIICENLDKRFAQQILNSLNAKELNLFFINPPNDERLEKVFNAFLNDRGLSDQDGLIRTGWMAAITFVQRWNIGFAVDGPHTDPDECPSWYDGCNCGVVKRQAALIETLKSALEREIAQCPDCGGTGSYSPMGEHSDCTRCKPSRDVLKLVQ